MNIILLSQRLSAMLVVGMTLFMSACGSVTDSSAEYKRQVNMKLQSVETDVMTELNGDKVNLGSVLALYPKPLTVIGMYVDGKVNWRLVSHTGILVHDRILISMKHSDYSNRGVMSDKKLSVNLVSRQMLPQADYSGSVSGAKVDKSQLFAYSVGVNGSPIINDSPLSMECNVLDVYETDGFDNFICEIANTYAAKHVLDAKGQIDYSKLKPVLFAFPSYVYIATGEVLGNCLQLTPETSMTYKEDLQEDGIVRLSHIQVDPQYLEEYKQYVTEVGAVSLRTEPGVLTMYAMQSHDDPCHVTILEIYASQDAYNRHVASAHFQKYKQGTSKMVRSLELIDQHALNKYNRLTNFMVND